MTIDNIKHIFERLSTCDAWSLQILQINTSKKEEISYLTREISIEPKGKLTELVKEIAAKYLEEGKNSLESYRECRDYDGSTDNQIIYKLTKDKGLIAEDYQSLLKAVAHPDTESNPLELKANASLIKGIIDLDGKKTPIKLISMQNPVTSLKHKFLEANGTFKEISDKVISLRSSIDVLLLGDSVYMFNLSGENLFNMERAYKGICLTKVELIKKADIVTDGDAFSSIAGSGHNPRKFVSFNDSYFDKLKKADIRKNIAAKFNLPLKDGKFDTSTKDTTEKLVKLLCQRGMVEPFDDTPMEVSSSKKWE